jgi:hypothetical protein
MVPQMPPLPQMMPMYAYPPMSNTSHVPNIQPTASAAYVQAAAPFPNQPPPSSYAASWLNANIAGSGTG